MKPATGHAERLTVLLAEDARSGLASIVQQYLEQQISESEARRARAARIRGRLGLAATDYGVSVTVDFGRDRITVLDGIQAPLDASISGPYASLTGLLQGRTNPLLEHLRGRLKVYTSLRNPLLALRVHGLLKLPPENAHPDQGR